MEYIVSPEEMKQSDTNTIEYYGIPSAVLMERAALQIAAYIKEQWGKAAEILVVAGTGNNGGDGLAAGRILALLGFKVTFVLVGEIAACSEETKRQLQICNNYHYKIMGKIPSGEYDIIVDAIFGIGLNRIIEGKYYEVIERINRFSCVKLAVDIPSGIHAGNGRILGICVEADVTITFGFKKIGQLLYPGAKYCGRLLCRDIGITMESFVGESPLIYSYQAEDIKQLPKRNPAGNKGSFGKILLVAGSINMSGACALSGLSAYRAGAGLVRIFTPQGNREIIQKMLPEAILTTYEKERLETKVLKEAMMWADCIAVGPGLGTSETAGKILQVILEEIKKPLIIDADGLNLLAEDDNLMRSIKEKTSLEKQNIIMTPHLGEFSRLSKRPIEELEQDKIASAMAFAEEYGVNLVCKDARTICCAGGNCAAKVYLNQSGNDGMATAGSGDVLTGIIAGLLSQGMDGHEAAVLGVYIHGLAGDRALITSNRYSLLASDIIEQLKYVMNGDLGE